MNPTDHDRPIAATRSNRADAAAGGLVETGTTIVGATGPDAAVLAADARASLGGRFVTNRDVRKIEPVTDRTAIAFSGSVGDAQSFARQLRASCNRYELSHDRPAAVATVASIAGRLARHGPYRVLDLVLAGVDDEPACYQLDVGGSVLGAPYAASGSGMQLAYGALEDSYEADLSPAELRRIAARAVGSATERDAASGDGMTIATITADGLEFESFEDVASAVAATGGDDGRAGAESSEEAV